LMAIRWRQAPIIVRSIAHISQVTPRPFTHISQVRQMQWRRVAVRPLCEGGGMANATIIERLS
jgi:hypothetical protein